MEFLYPKFNKVTHILNKNAISSKEYPATQSFISKKDITIENDTKICLIRDNIGFDCLWSQIICLEGPNKNQIFYVLTKDLQSVNAKISYTAICTLENTIDTAVSEIDPNTKEILTPYIDKRNGLYSVRIQTDSEKAVSSFVFENLVNEVLLEGVGILLSSRGYRYDNEYIQSLMDKYHRFAYVNNDINLTINRACEPLTFTVSIPLNFFNEAEIVAGEIPVGVTKKLLLNNRNFKTYIKRVIELLQSIEEDVQKLLYPSNFIENFIISFEIQSLNTFASQFSEFVSLQNFSINEPNIVNFYEIGLDNDLNILSFSLENISKNKILNPAELAAYRLKSELSSKRIYNYLLNINEMSSDVRSMDVKEFIFKYVKYPDPRLLSDTIVVNGKNLPEEKVKQFKADYLSSAEECINISDLTSISRTTRSLVSFGDPLYHLFLKQDIKNVEDYNTYISFKEQGKTSEEALNSLNDLLKKSQQKTKEATEAEEFYKRELQYKAKENIDQKETEIKQINESLTSVTNDLNSKQTQLNALINEKKNIQGPPDPTIDSKIEGLQKDVNSLKNQQNNVIKQKTEQADNLKSLQQQKDTIEQTPAGVLAQDKTLKETLGELQIENFKAAFSKLSPKNELIDALTTSITVNFSFVNSVAGIQYSDSNAVNISTLLYLLNRINTSEILFKKLLCTLKGVSPDAPEISEIISQIPPEVINYFNYLRTVKELNGTAYVDALERGLVPDIKLYCSKNNALVYFVKGLKKIVGTLNSTASFAINVLPTLTQSRKLTSKTNPYEVFAKNFSQNVIRTITSLLIDTIREVLNDSCEDPLQYLPNPNNNYKDPFSTHYPISGFGGSSENNNNPNILSRNRGDILDKIYFRELQFGFDKEYTVDLIGRLLKDINCILTPIESVNLLKGESTELVKTLIKNIIKAKYSSPPNDLSFLLKDENKLKQFFKELGLTVDPDYMAVITQTVNNYLEPSSLCDEPTLRARTDLLQNKIPKDLGTLDRQQQKRIQTAKKLFERIKSGNNGGGTIEVSPLCPDFSNDDVESAKDAILDRYKKSVSDTFTNVLTEFTQEAIQIPNIYTEKDFILRRDENGKLFDSFEVPSYNSTLGANLNYPVSDSPNIRFIDPYSPKDLVKKLSDQADIFIPKKQSQNKSFQCLADIAGQIDTSINKEFYDFLEENNIIVEFAQDFQFDSDNGDLSELTDRNQAPYNYKYATYLRGKDYFITISLQANQVNPDLVSFKVIYNDKATNKFKIKDEITYSGLIVESENYESDNFYDNLEVSIYTMTKYLPDDAITNLQTLEVTEGNYITINNILKESIKTKPQAVLNKADDIYLLTRKIFDIALTQNSKNLIINAYSSFKKSIDEAKKFNNIIKDAKKIEYNGYFNNTSIFNDTNVNKQINLIGYTTGSNVAETTPFAKTFINLTSSISIPYSDSGYQPKIISLYDNLKKYLYNGSYYTPFSEKEYLKLLKAKKKGDDIPWDETNTVYLSNPEKNDPRNPDLVIKLNSDTFFQDKTYQIVYNSEQNIFEEVYSRYSSVNIPQDQRYISCNIYPHYFNLDYILEQAIVSKKNELCDIGNYNVNDILKICIVEITIRTYITDLLIKAIPYLSTFSKENLQSLHNKDTIIKILLEFFKKDIKIFSPDNKTDGFESYYFKYFSKAVEEVYKIYEKNSFLKQQFVSQTSANPSLEYFIKKEVFRTIKYMLEKDMIVFINKNTNRTYGDYAEAGKTYISQIFGNNIKQENSSLYNNLLEYWKLEYETMLAYFLMSQSVDNIKSSIFYSTKSSLASIFFSNLNDIAAVDIQEGLDISSAQRKQEDIIRFLQNLASSPNPTALALNKPEYSRYVKKYLNLLLQTTRNTLSTLAENTDPNISLTKKLQSVLSFVSSLSFSLMDESARNLAIASDPTYTMKRISDGRSPSPDVLIAASIGFFIPPLVTGWAYLAVDSIDEASYMKNAIKEVDQLSKAALKGVDPCVATPEQKNEAIESMKCSPENKKILTNELNSLEQVNDVVEATILPTTILNIEI